MDEAAGRGTVFISRKRDGTLWALWQEDATPYALGEREGDEESVLAWARAQPADKRLLFSNEANDYLPLDGPSDRTEPSIQPAVWAATSFRVNARVQDPQANEPE